MTPLGVVFVLFAFVVSTQAIGFRGFTYEGLREPEYDVSRARSVDPYWIDQPVDHFNARDNRTWSMRYFQNDDFFNGTGPILIMLGGEWAISASYVLTGPMYEMGKAHGAMLYYTEHRYYGSSHPVKDAGTENLQYLSIDQALADVAYFIEAKKKSNPGLANSNVVVFGGSYAGTMAAWMRLKYPHLVQGAVASSGPFRMTADFFEYYDVVANSLARSSNQCIEDVRSAFEKVEEILGFAPILLKNFFNLCDEPDASSPSAVGYFMNILTEKFAGIVQYNNIAEDGSSAISKICDVMTDKSIGAPILRLAGLFSGDECLDISYENFVETHRQTSWPEIDRNGIMRLWLYQTCTEFGLYQTTSSNNSFFGSLIPVEFYTQMCSDLYGEYYDSMLLESKVKRTNLMYGSSKPDVRNVVFTNGNVDPWHALSVLEDLNEDSPAILIDGSSHCQDLNPEYKTDVPELVAARKRVWSLVAGWLNGE